MTRQRAGVLAARALRLLAALALMAACVMPLSGFTGTSSSSAVATAAQQELDTYSAGSGGEKYWKWMGFGSRVPWCACFASYCADQAGLIEAGYAPKNAAVQGWIEFYQANPQAGSLNSPATYTPQDGDFIIWQDSGRSHIGIVTGYDASTDQVSTIEGNTSNSVGRHTYPKSSCTYYAHPAGSGSYSGLAGCSVGGTGSLSGDTVSVPSGLGRLHTYMGWSLVTATDSAQYRLRELAGESYDDEGFAKINGRYVIACTTTFGDIGDYIDWYQEDGTVIETVVGDTKNQSDEGCNEWGHQNGQVIVEFVVNKDTWYGTGHANPGNPGCHPEWNQCITKAVKGGNYLSGDASTTSSGSMASGLSGCSASGSSSAASAAKAKLDLTEDYRSAFNHGAKSASQQKYIVLHDTEVDASASAIVDSWESSGNGVAAHFVVNKDGSIVQCVPLDAIAHHAGYGDTGHNELYGVEDDGRDDKVGTAWVGSGFADYGMNSYSIGIEMVHVGGSGGYSDAQLEAVDNLIAYIDAYYGRSSAIIDHKDWRTGNSDTSAEFAGYLENYKASRTHNG